MRSIIAPTRQITNDFCVLSLLQDINSIDPDNGFLVLESRVSKNTVQFDVFELYAEESGQTKARHIDMDKTSFKKFMEERDCNAFSLKLEVKSAADFKKSILNQPLDEKNRPGNLNQNLTKAREQTLLGFFKAENNSLNGGKKITGFHWAREQIVNSAQGNEHKKIDMDIPEIPQLFSQTAEYIGNVSSQKDKCCLLM